LGRNVEGCSERKGVDLIQGVGGILVLVDMHLEKPLGGSKEFDIKAIVHGIFKLLFDGILATNVEHVVNKNRRRSHWLCLLYWTK
jgi:hypothetical protein